MRTGRCLAFLAALAVSVPLAAVAQIPSSEEPGQVRQRFDEMPPPQARPTGPTISLRGSIAPEGAAAITLFVSDVRIVGATVYSATDFESLTSDVVGQQVTLSAIYALAVDCH